MRIGIDLGGTKTEGVILGPGGEEIIRRRYPTPQTEGYEAILNTIGSMVAELEHMAGRQCTVGVCTPGAVSQLNGCLKNSNTVCMNGRPVARDLETLLDRPVRLENDANCFALAEAIDGAGKNAGSVFGIILGTGVGAGIVINRTLIKGLHHIAGEWGPVRTGQRLVIRQSNPAGPGWSVSVRAAIAMAGPYLRAACPFRVSPHGPSSIADPSGGSMN